MNPTAIFSKTGKGVQEASGKTSHLSRADRAVLKEIDGKTAHASVAAKFETIPADKFDALIQQFDKDGYIREVSSGAQPAAASTARTVPSAKSAPPPPPSGGGGDDMDFTQAIKLPPRAPAAPAGPKPPPMDLAAASRAEANRKSKEQQEFDYKTRQEVELKAKAEAEAKARAAAEARVRAESDARAKAELEARAQAASGAKALAEADAKVKAAREAAVRMATEVKAKAEAEGKAKADELTGKLEQERKAREDAERRASEATERARKELEEKAKRDAEELRQKLESEMKAKLDEERKAREEEDRKRREEDDRKRAEQDHKRREEEDRKRREEDERRRKEEEERRAKEAEERRLREEEDRKRREEEDRRRKEEAEKRAKEDAERRAREEADRAADRKRREEEDRKRAEEDKRRKEDADRRANEDADRRARDDADRRAREDSDAKARAAQAASASSASLPSIEPVAAPPPPPPPAASGGIADSLFADLESFGKREEEEQKAKEEAERKAKEEAARKARETAERQAKEEADRKAKAAADKQRREEDERRAQEEAERSAREEAERQKQEEAERKRKAKESLAAKEAERKAAQRAAAAKGAGKDIDDIEVTNDDLDRDDIKKDEKALAARARKAAQEQLPAAAVASVRRPRKWGKPAVMVLFALLVGGIGVLHVMPLPTLEYENAASEAMGVPVKIGSARLSVITGIEVKLEGVSIGGDAVKIRVVRGVPEVGSLFGEKKAFSRIELEGVSLSQAQLGDAVLGKVSGEKFRVARITIKQAKFDGPLSLPPLDVDAVVASDGALQSVTLRGGDKLSVQLSPKGRDIGFEISAGSLAVPFAPALNLSDFEMKGTANRGGVTASEFNGRAYDGTIFGSAKMRWGGSWVVDGEVRARGVKVAVFAPALVSEGKVEGRGNYTMSGANPATLFESARLQGEFKIEKGVLGSFDLTRALQTGGAQSGGSTVFSELTGQGVYDKGAIRISNVAITAGAMNAGATLDIDANGGLSGRVVADVKTPNQTLRATLNVSGKIQDPVIRK